jgi:hypothetical protein
MTTGPTDYAIYLYAPKFRRLTPKMVEWLIAHGADSTQPEVFHPVRRVNPHALASLLLAFDGTLQPMTDEYGAVVLMYPAAELNLRLIVHERGVVIAFPFMGALLAQIVLRITYTYICFLYERAGFWSYDPQINVISCADDFLSIEEAAQLMEAWLPHLLNG